MGEDKKAEWLKNAAVKNDSNRLDKVILAAQNNSTKIDKFLAKINGDFNNFTNIVDNILPLFSPQPPLNVDTSLTVDLSAYGFDAINIEHILGKHSLAHFNFDKTYLAYQTHDIDFFPVGTTQQQVLDWIRQAIEQLNQNKNINFIPKTDKSEIVTIEQYSFIVGSKIETNQTLLGQFYPRKSEYIPRVSYNKLLALRELFTQN